jgi:hypothetical protein
MKLEDLLSGMEFDTFIKEYFENYKLLYLKNVVNPGVFPLQNIENFVKKKENYQFLRKISGGRYINVLAEPKRINEFYESISNLTGDELWSKFCEGEYSLHISSFLSALPELKKLSVDLYKKFSYGCQSYLVVSHDLKYSSLSHHTDPMDLFVVQLQGSKAWQVAMKNEEQVLRNNLEQLPYDSKDTEGVKFKKLTMKEGDIAFIPFRAAHHVSITSNKTSIHFVIGLRRRYYEQILLRFMESIRKNISTREPYETYDFATDNYKEILNELSSKLGEFSKELDMENFSKILMTESNDYDLIRTIKG